MGNWNPRLCAGMRFVLLRHKYTMKTKKVPFLVSLAAVIEWLGVALVFAFVFRAFVIEAFKIPTGSMAPTLRGDHFEVACMQCGYEYDVNRQAGAEAQRQIVATKYRCPSCGYAEHILSDYSGGDRILVYKSIYSFKDPDRWDVFVFKNPTEPHINYIKRVVGRPGETLEIIDGDVFIDGRIARKPAKVMREMWMPVYDGDYIPARPQTPSFNNGRWKVPFVQETGWSSDKGGAVFKLDSRTETLLTYDMISGNNFQSTYAYNAPVYYKFQEECSDFRVKFWVDGINDKSMIGAKISKYGRTYTAKVDFETAKMQILGEHGGKTELIAELLIDGKYPDKPVMYSFDNADYKLTLNFGRYRLEKEIGQAYGDIGTYNDGKPAVELCGKGKLALSHFTLCRDIHYVSRRMMRTDEIRAGEGNPITLGADEFFACGDNSPESLDSRLWTSEGIGNNGKKYPMGVVPRDYLIGEAFFVYWPGGYKTAPRSTKPALIPNVGLMRWIYGGGAVVSEQ